MLLVCLLGGVVYGTLGWTLGRAAYVRSGHYRAECEADLTDTLGLPSEIGAVIPRSRQSQEFQNVRVHLVGRRGEAAHIDRAVVARHPTADDPNAYEIELYGGHCEVSTRTWLREDYRFVIESGLRPGFSPDGPRRITFSDVSLLFDRERFRLSFGEAYGRVEFPDLQHGTAAITCRDFNGLHLDEPVTLVARFSPQSTGVQMDEVQLRVPTLPLDAIGLGELAGVPLHSGTFDGRLAYRELGTQRESSVSGHVRDLRLADIGNVYAGQPWHGTAQELTLQELRVVNGQPRRVHCSGLFDQVVLGDLLAPFGLGGLGGTITLRVEDAQVTPAGIERLVLAGTCDALDLHELSLVLGRGEMTGSARVVITDLTIIENHVASLDAVIEVTAPPAATELPWVSRELIAGVVADLLGLPIGALLPERVHYEALGLRLEIRDEELFVFGTQGPDEHTILTVRVAGRSVPLVREPAEPYDLRPYFDQLRLAYETRLRSHIEALQPDAAWEALAPGHNPPRTPSQSPEDTP